MIRKLVLAMVAVLAGGCLLASAQNKQVTGTVTDPQGQPLAGVTVLVKGTQTAVGTDPAGQYSISVPADGVLQFSYIGYQPQEIPVGAKNVVDVQMKEDAESIDDIVVIAFGQQKREAFTGSASTVGANMIAQTQTSNVAQALAGQVPGVQLSNASGQPGSAPTILIRGFSSINAKNDPLVVLDGIPINGGMENINPSDIESMTVLKDAASNALYGARGANGVIMITTKRGRSGDAVVTVDAKWGVNSRAVQAYDYIEDPAQYYETHYRALYNNAVSGGASPLSAHATANSGMISGSTGLGYQVFNVPDGQYFIGTNGRVNPNATLGNIYTGRDGNQYMLTPDDWNDEAFRSSLRQEYNVNVAGATDRSNFYGSFGYLNDKGIVANSDFIRYTARMKADFQAKKWLKVGGNVGYANFDGNRLTDEGDAASSGNLFALTSRVAPIYPLYIRNADGQIMYDQRGFKRYDYGSNRVLDGIPGLERPVFGQANPLSSSQLDTDNYEGNAVNANGFFDVTFLKDFKFTFNAGMDLDETRSTSITNPFYGQYASSNGTVYKLHTRKFGLNLQQLLNYTKTIAGDHNLNVMAGHEYYNYKYYYLSASKSNMFSPDNHELAGAITDGSQNSYRTEYNTEGYFGRVNYDFQERIFVSGSYRRDASSRFHPDHRWGNFWSVGAAWLMNRESWFNATWVDELKLKASYGSQGNDNIPAYRYTDTFLIKNAGGYPGIPFNAPGTEDLTWETNANFNVGTEFGLWGNRLTGSIEYFYRKTTDMLFSFPTPPSLGYGSVYDNIGDMRNSGIEVDLQGLLVNSKNVQWSVNLNLTHLRNKVTMLAEANKSIDGIGFANGNYLIAEGHSRYTWYMPKYAGVNDKGQAQWYKKVKDAEGNVIGNELTTVYAEASEEGMYVCGSALPDLYGGFGTALRAYGFDLSVNFTYQIGGKAYDSGYAASMYSPLSNNKGSNWHRDILKAWSPENPDSTIPRLQYGDQNSASQSDRFLTDASYLNIQNINVGYTLPAKFTRKFGVERLRIYASCENVWYWSARQGFDPRQAFSGATNAARYSPIRTISGGITLQF